MTKSDDPLVTADWGSVHDEGNAVVLKKFSMSKFHLHIHHLRSALVVPKAEISPNKIVMGETREQHERWRQATYQELVVLLKDASQKPTAAMLALTCIRKPASASKVWSTEDSMCKAPWPTRMHLFRRFLAARVNPQNVWANFDVSNALLSAELSDDLVILAQPPLSFTLVGETKSTRPMLQKHAMACEKRLVGEKQTRQDSECLTYQHGKIERLWQNAHHPNLWLWPNPAMIINLSLVCQMTVIFQLLQCLVNRHICPLSWSTSMMFSRLDLDQRSNHYSSNYPSSKTNLETSTHRGFLTLVNESGQIWALGWCINKVRYTRFLNAWKTVSCCGIFEQRTRHCVDSCSHDLFG